MAVADTDKIVTEAEIQAALAEAEASSAIPSLDDTPVEFVPVPTGPELRPIPRDPLSAATPPPAAPPPPAAAAPPPAREKAPLAEAASAVPSGPGVLYRIVESVLIAVNWPFAWLGAGGRKWLGLMGGVTLVMSGTAVFLLPRLFPHRDAITALSERVSDVQAGKLHKAPEESKEKRAAGGGHGGEATEEKGKEGGEKGQESGGHGEPSKAAGGHGQKSAKEKAAPEHGAAKESGGHGGAEKPGGHGKTESKGGKEKPAKDAGGGHGGGEKEQSKKGEKSKGGGEEKPKH
jgi:hypothetical protein